MFMIFGGERYYSSGGANDFIASTDDIGKAVDIANGLIGKYLVYGDEPYPTTIKIEWVNIMDASTGDVVKSVGDNPYGLQSQATTIKSNNE